MQTESLVLCCYGVEVRLVDDAGLWLCQRLRETLPPEFAAPSGPPQVSVVYVVTAVVPPGLTEASEFLITCDEVAVFATAVDEEVFWWLRRDIDQAVARRCTQLVFVHAGVVGWRGVGIVIPGRASIGKSTLVVELVRRGAVYYSDAFAALDDAGRVHPYRGMIGLDGESRPRNLRLVREDGATDPLPIKLITAGAYTPGVVWRPAVVRGSHAALSLVESSVLAREVAPRLPRIAAQVAADAVALRGPRSEAAEVAALLLDTVDDALVSLALGPAEDNRGRLADELARVAEIQLRSPHSRPMSPPRRLVAARYVRKLDVLPPADHRRLLQYVLSGESEVWESRVVGAEQSGNTRDEIRQSPTQSSERHDEIWDILDRRVQTMLPFVRQELEIRWFPRGRIEWQLTAHGQGGDFVPRVDADTAGAPGRRISCVYYFHQAPKPFSGGELKLYDTWITSTGTMRAGTYTTLEPVDNSLVFFPSDAFHEVCPVHPETDALADSRFAITIWFWQAGPPARDSNLAGRVVDADPNGGRCLPDDLAGVADTEPPLPLPAGGGQPRGAPHSRRLVAVVVPAHRFPLSGDDQIAIRHLRTHLGEFDRYMIGPHIPPDDFADFARPPSSACDFVDRSTYNRLLMSERFYRAFEGYRYILIYQLDCLVFSNTLEEWCRKGFDYIGAPWFERWHNFRREQSEYPEDVVEGFGTVGNGGFSLRSVDAALAVLSATKMSLHDRFVQRVVATGLNEDIFWSFYAPKLVDEFRIPKPREALQFAFETEPRYCYRENDHRLPFGCHGWLTYERDFWEPFLLT
jgi:Rps23 Pro-64 3,4-dihydroxylase Tpa1-like proline 4-hydroxylase